MLDTLPDGPRGRALAVAMLAIVLAVGWFGIATPLMDYYGSRADLIAQRGLVLDHATRLVASLPDLRAASANAAPSTSGLLDGDTDAVAAAGLQDIVQDMASGVGASLTSSEVLSGPTEGGFRQVGLRVTLRADWQVLVALLKAVEGSPRQWLVDDLHLHISAEPSAAGPGATVVEASFIVIGFRPVPAAAN